jgi:hypothetical protein
VKQTREALELVEGAGARSLQKYVKEDPKVIEVQYTETLHCSVALNLQLDTILSYGVIDVMSVYSRRLRWLCSLWMRK